MRKKEPFALTSLYCTTASLMDEEQADYLGAINSICTSASTSSTTTNPKRKHVDVMNTYIASLSDEELQKALSFLTQKEEKDNKTLVKKMSPRNK